MFANITRICCFCLAFVAIVSAHYVATDKVITSRCVGRVPRASKKSYTVVCSKKANWIGALIYCNSHGMRLATVENREQEKAIIRALKTAPCRDSCLWIGGTNQHDVNRWVWESTGKEVSHRFGWYEGKPDFPQDEHCLEMLPDMSGFNDKCCDRVQSFVCETLSGEILEKEKS